MYHKVIAIINEVKNETVKVPYALKTLDAIAQYALQQGDITSKKLADTAFALMPNYKDNGEKLIDTLTELQISVAQPAVKRLEKKLLEHKGYDTENYDDTILSLFFTDNGTMFVWLLDKWSDSEGWFKANAIILDNGKDEIMECDSIVKDKSGEDYLVFILAALKDMGY